MISIPASLQHYPPLPFSSRPAPPLDAVALPPPLPLTHVRTHDFAWRQPYTQFNFDNIIIIIIIIIVIIIMTCIHEELNSKVSNWELSDS